ncbi:MAG TPA: hypothetical protein VIL99_16320 [Ignavibacteria bacterium]
MKCSKCGIDFHISKDLNGKSYLEDENYYECAICHKQFCPKHLKPDLLSNFRDEFDNNNLDKICFVNLCENCNKK